MNFKEQMLNYLCPAGSGVYTVNTAAERKNAIFSKLYGSSVPEIVSEVWQQSIEHYFQNPVPALIAIPSDCGAGILRGSNWGPLFLRQEMYQYSVDHLFDLGDVRVIPHLLHDKYLNTQTISSCQKALYQKVCSLPVSPLSIAEVFCRQFYQSFPQTPLLTLGGDHSISYPLCNEWIKRKKREKVRTAVIHFDAHTDLLSQRLGIDLCFGSWTYHILKNLAHPSDVYQIGIRSSGKDKKYWENHLGVKQFWAQEIIQEGIESTLHHIRSDLKKKKVQELYVSLDIDCIDSEYVSCTGTPEPNGLQPHMVSSILNELRNDFLITGADIVEVAPFLKTQENPYTIEPESTLQIATSFVHFFTETFHGNY